MEFYNYILLIISIPPSFLKGQSTKYSGRDACICEVIWPPSITTKNTDCSNNDDAEKSTTVQLLQEQLLMVIRELNDMKDRYAALRSPVNGTVTTHYTRWGYSQCPDNATLVYSGYTGKGKFDEYGGADYQCLPQHPEFPSGTQAGAQAGAAIYASEYRKSQGTILQNVHHDNIPCAVCLVEGKSSTLMIPAKLSCPDKWQLEYSGWLASSYPAYKGVSTYICLDKELDVVTGGGGQQNIDLVYVVEVRSGFPSPPFTDGYELGCVVCTI